MGEHGDGVTLDGQSGESVGDGDGKVTGGGSELGDGLWMEGATQIRLAKVSGSVGCVTSQLENCD